MGKADWANFIHYAEIEFEKIDDANPDVLSISQLNGKFVGIFISKAAKNIPKTSSEKPRKTPLPKEAVKKIQVRNKMIDALKKQGGGTGRNPNGSSKDP